VGWIQLTCQQNRPGKLPPTRALGPDLTWRRDDVRAFCPIDADTFRLDPREDAGRGRGRRGPCVSSVIPRSCCSARRSSCSSRSSLECSAAIAPRAGWPLLHDEDFGNMPRLKSNRRYRPVGAQSRPLARP